MALKELISTIARSLVDDPDSVEVTEIEYGEDESVPNSFFSKLTIELVAMSKPPEETASEF